MTENIRCLFAYHGTTPEIAKEILRSGEFKAGTYFALVRDDAIAFGGSYIFTVRFSGDGRHWKGEFDGWQFHLRDPYPVSSAIHHGPCDAKISDFSLPRKAGRVAMIRLEFPVTRQEIDLIKTYLDLMKEVLPDEEQPNEQ